MRYYCAAIVSLLCLALLGATLPAAGQSDVWVDLEYPGAEVGTSLAPFDTVAEALGAVSAGGVVHLEPQDSHETITVNQNLRLETTGGTARIGVLSSYLGSGAPLEWLRIVEIMYNPADGGAEYLELQNTGPVSLDISGVYFSDGITFSFPAITTINSGERFVLVRDSDQIAFGSLYGGVSVNGVYTGALSNGGETIALSTSDNIEFLSLTYNDGASWPVLADGQGWSLVIIDPQGNGSDPDNWRASTNADGSPGSSEINPDIPGIVINEILSHTDPDSDTIELYNPTGSTVDVRGWYLSDNDDIPLKARIPMRSEFNIAAGAYAVITQTDFFDSPGSGLSGFRLSKFGEQVFIFSADGGGLLTGYSHGFNFGAQVEGVSFGRIVTSDDREHFVTQTSQSFGSANPGAEVGGLVISEIHYNPVPDGVEYIKITNLSGSAIKLYDDSDEGDPGNTYKVQGIGFKFPTGQSIAAGESVLIVNMPPQHYKARFGDPGIAVYGSFGNYEGADAFGLSNGDETLRVQWPEHKETNPDTGLEEVRYITLDQVRYDDDPPWPNADNNYKSISRSGLAAFGGEPTNWTANNAVHQAASAEATVGAVNFSLTRGFYTGNQNLTMSTATPIAEIWYATDGSYPAPDFGASTQYTGTVTLSGSAAIRAAAFKTDYLPSEITDATYILNAPSQQTAIDALAIIGDAQEELFHPHGVMAINGGTYVRSFSSIQWRPNLPNYDGGLQDFNPAAPGIQWANDALGNPVYVAGGARDFSAFDNPILRGRFVERPASFEFLDPNNPGNNLQVDAGIRVHGSTFHRSRYAMHPDDSGDWTLPYTNWTGNPTNTSHLKFSLRMYFRGDYGPTKLDWPVFPGDPLSPNYDKVVLRGGHGDGFNPFIRDELTRRLFIDMGNVCARGNIYGLYINGVYRGYYNITERHDADFLANRFGASKNWDILSQQVGGGNDPELRDGDKVSWDELIADVTAQENSSSQANYDAIAERLDIDAFIDYLLVQLYVGNWDWPNNNWTAVHERLPGQKWYFLVWDAEASFEEWTLNLTGIDNFPGANDGTGLNGEDTPVAHIYRACVLNAGFRTAFSDRAFESLGSGGALDTVNVQARYDELEAIMLSVLRDGETFDDYIDTGWIAGREAPLIADLQAEGLYPPS